MPTELIVAFVILGVIVAVFLGFRAYQRRQSRDQNKESYKESGTKEPETTLVEKLHLENWLKPVLKAMGLAIVLLGLAIILLFFTNWDGLEDDAATATVTAVVAQDGSTIEGWWRKSPSTVGQRPKVRDVNFSGRIVRIDEITLDFTIAEDSRDKPTVCRWNKNEEPSGRCLTGDGSEGRFTAHPEPDGVTFIGQYEEEEKKGKIGYYTFSFKVVG